MENYVNAALQRNQEKRRGWETRLEKSPPPRVWAVKVTHTKLPGGGKKRNWGGKNAYRRRISGPMSASKNNGRHDVQRACHWENA